MSVGKKKALLDADFVIKSVIAKKDESNHLIDLLLEDQTFEFFCHEKILTEVAAHDVEGASEWLETKVKNGQITMVSDADMLNQLSSVYRQGASRKYRDFLKKSCDAFKTGYYESAFSAVEELPIDVDDKLFLSELLKCDTAIGPHQSLGEKKSLILLQLFRELMPGQVYLFCSDDRGARAGVISFADDVKCLSLLSAFCLLKENGVKQEDAEPYFKAYENHIKEKTNQTQFRVINQKGDTYLRVDCYQVFSEIYRDLFIDTDAGWLRYKK